MPLSKLLDFLGASVADDIQIESLHPAKKDRIDAANQSNGIQIRPLSERMQPVRFFAAHFLDTAFGRVTYFIVDNGLQLLAYGLSLRTDIRGPETAAFKHRTGQYLAQKSEGLAKQAFLALNKRVIDCIHAELDDLVISALINVESETGSIQLF